MRLSLRIDWSDMDHFGHVNNIAFFRYIQSARVNFWEKTGVMDHYEKTGVGPILASCHCDFKKALEYPGTVTIETSITRIGETSFCFSHILYNDANEIAATAADVIVIYDFNANKKSPIPASVRASLESGSATKA